MASFFFPISAFARTWCSAPPPRAHRQVRGLHSVVRPTKRGAKRKPRCVGQDCVGVRRQHQLTC